MARYNFWAPDVQQASDVAFQGHHDEAIRLFKSYLSRVPDDLDALSLLAKSLRRQGNCAEGLKTAMQVLEQAPRQPYAAGEAALCLLEMGDPVQSRNLLEAHTPFPDLDAVRVDSSNDADYPHQWLAFVYWCVLDDLKDYEAALPLAYHYADKDAFWRNLLVTTLIALKRTTEAEALYGTQPDTVRQGLWDIAFTLVHQQMYEEGLLYFQRCLGFAMLPQDFTELIAYIECLLIAKHLDEASILCSQWLQRKNVKSSRKRKCLHLLLAVADVLKGDVEATRKHMNHVCFEENTSACLKKLRKEFHFEETLSTIDGLIQPASTAFGSSA